MKAMTSGRGATPTIQVLERSFRVARRPGVTPGPVSLKVISEQSGLHPSTAHRILNDLAAGGFVERPRAGSYRLGMRLLELGNLVKARLDVRDAALGPMRELHRLPTSRSTCRCAKATRSCTSNAPTANVRACRSCAPWAAARRCT